MHQAVATSAGVGVRITILATVGYVWPDGDCCPFFVSLVGLVIVAPISTLAAPHGARVAYRLSRGS
jgi:uncharacterized protein